MGKINNLILTVEARGVTTAIFAIWNLFIKSLEEVFLRRRYIKRQIHDYKMLLDVKDSGISRSLILFRRREEDHKILLKQIMHSRMRVFDIGANIGYYALMELSMLEDEKQLVAFEPVKDNYKLLKKNLDLNGFKNVTVLNAAISNEGGERDFFLAQESNLGSFHKSDLNQSSSSGGVSKVKVLSFQQAVEEYGAPDLIRMDVEGHEVEILSQVVDMAAKGTVSSTIIFETHLRHYTGERDFKKVLKRFFSVGYRIPLAASSQASGTDKLIKRGYVPYQKVKTDGLQRGLFLDIKEQDALDFIIDSGGLRTVVLKKGS